MPELPEVETMRRGILGAAGGRVENVEVLPCERKPILVCPGIGPFRRRVRGRVVREVGRVGKRVVLSLEGSLYVVFEPRMTGLILVSDPPSHEHLRFELTLSGAAISSFRYWDRRGLGSIRLLSQGEYDERLGPDRLGPDALAVDEAQMRDRLAGSRRPIKTALLDQRALAGIGNLYASEILHLAGIHPASGCDRLSAAQWTRIHRATREVLELAIRYEGSTLGDGTYRNALNKAGGFQNHHRVYDRAGQACPSCARGRVTRIVQAQRSTFYCPNCQRIRRQET